MSPKFFFNKLSEVASFLKIMRGKATGNKKDRVEGVDAASDEMKDEKQVYLDGKRQALNEMPQSGQDISAI